jgi:hypothetical protein
MKSNLKPRSPGAANLNPKAAKAALKMKEAPH